MDFTKDYYRILGVFPSASLNDIRRAYRVQALRWHPDMHGGESPEDIAKAEEMFKAVNEAYSVLGNPANRSSYDYYYRRPSTSQHQAHSQGNGSTGNTTSAGYSRQYYGSSYGYYYRNTDSTSSSASVETGEEENWRDVLRMAIKTAVFAIIALAIYVSVAKRVFSHEERKIYPKMETRDFVMPNMKKVEFKTIDMPEIEFNDGMEDLGWELKYKNIRKE